MLLGGQGGCSAAPSPPHSAVPAGTAVSNSLAAAGSPSEVLGALCLVREFTMARKIILPISELTEVF